MTLLPNSANKAFAYSSLAPSLQAMRHSSLVKAIGELDSRSNHVAIRRSLVFKRATSLRIMPLCLPLICFNCSKTWEARIVSLVALPLAFGCNGLAQSEGKDGIVA